MVTASKHPPTMSSQRERNQPEPHEEEQLSHTHVDSGAEIARLKRRLAASQEEVRELTHGKTKKPPYVYLLPVWSVIV